MSRMRPAAAILALEELKAEAEPPMNLRPSIDSWKARVMAVLVRALGKDHDILQRFKDVRYSLGFFTDRTPKSAFDSAFVSGVATARGLIDAAIYDLGLEAGDEPVDEHAYDYELWAHVKGLVEDDEWGKVASQTAIFVESHVRTWAGDPKDRNGNSLVGKALYLEVFGDVSDYRLGAQASEREGWRYLGMGFAQAVSNVDRHRIQKRDDAKRYALGVLGLGSLLLTQLRYEHGDILKS